ncbi:restriction endonuclease subunit S [Deinococcus proteolyticus]|nr:restriction endonuclease subunit S [Deinococcus proteolyticus]
MAEGGKQKARGVPEGWRGVKLGEMVECFSGGTPSRTKPEYYGGDIPWIKSGELNSGNIYATEETITEAGLQNSSAKVAKAGTLLFALYGATAGVIGRTRIDAAINQAILAIEPSEELLSEFLEYFLSSSVGNLLHLTQGGQPNFNAGIVKGFPLLLPPLPEQRKIAAILSTWDDSLANLTDLLAAKRQQKRGLAEALLTGQKRLPGFEGEWEEKKLGDIAKVYQPVTITSADLKASGYPVYGANGKIGYYDKYNHEQWQTLVTCRGSSSGAVSRSEDYAWITGNAMVINVDNVLKVDKQFIYQMMLSKDFSSLVSGSGQPQITKKPLEDFAISLPPLPEQQAIASVLSTLDSEIASLEALKAKVQEQKRGLMDELLTGRVRVKVNVEDSV